MPGEPDSRKLSNLKARIGDRLLLDDLQEQLHRTRTMILDSPESAAEAALDQFGSDSASDAKIAAALADTTPLAQPDRFLEAHRLTMHALEVLNREGSSNPPVRRAGPLKVFVQPAVEFVAEYIVKSYAEGVAGSLRSLYTRREVQCLPESEERRLLTRARVEANRVAPGYSGGGVLAPLLIVGGLALPLLASLTKGLGTVDFSSRPVLIPAIAILFTIFFLLSSVLLQGAAVARRRSRMIMQKPLQALWETVGNAGNPPEDDSVLYASVAIMITAVLWFVLPGAIAAAYFLFR